MMAGPTIAAVGELRAKLWDAGFRPIPVFNHNADVTSPGKQPLGTKWQVDARHNPPFCATSPAVQHALNTGILCDGLRPIDLDIDDPEIAQRCRALAVSMLGEAPVRARQGSPRALVLYGAAAGEPVKRSLTGRSHAKDHACKIEILGRGQQFVAFGRHHSGADLEWFPHAPGEELREALPAVTEDQIQAFLEACAAILDAPPPIKPNGHDQDHASADPQADPLRIAAALASIPNSGPTDWEAWNRVGMAVWRATGGSSAGWEAFNAWSAPNAGYDSAATRARWDHYTASPPTSIGAGTIFHMAAGVEKRAGRGDGPGGDRPPDSDAAGEPPSHPSRARRRSAADPDFVWPAPVDFLTDPNGEAPELGHEHIPAAINEFVFDTAERMGVDPTSVALGCIVSLASVASDDWMVQPKCYDYTWTENPRLWGAIVGDPSIKKTPVISACTRPIDKLDADARARHAKAMRDYRKRMKEAKADQSGDTPEPLRPKLDRYFIENTTVEALSEILRDDDEALYRAPARKVLCRQDEMSEFFANLDRYRPGGKGGGDRGAYLRLYNGGRYSIDRIGRGSFSVPNWSACFLGGMQPGPIQDIAKSATEDGLLQRFLYGVPGPQDPGVDRKPLAAAQERYNALFPALIDLHPPRTREGTVVFHADAHQHREAVDVAARAMGLMPDTSTHLLSAYGKWPGLFARVALTFHLIELADATANSTTPPDPLVISEQTAHRAAAFMLDIALPHLLRAHRLMFSTTLIGHTQWIAGYILAERYERITSRDVVRAYRALRAPEAQDELEAVMASLVTLGWLEPEVPTNSAKPVNAWVVNPVVHVKLADRAERERARRDKAREDLAAYLAARSRKQAETNAI